jgi:hypothetical protein
MSAPNSTKALLGASGLLLLAGAALAISQPGDLGDDERETGAGPPAEATTTTVEVDDPTVAPTSTTIEVTTTTAGEATDTTASAAGATTTTAPTTTTSAAPTSTAPPATTATSAATATTGTTAPPVETTTTQVGSGLGNGGASVADASTAATGMESLLGPGLGLAALAVGARAAARRRPAA